MALRLIEALILEDQAEDLRERLATMETHEVWCLPAAPGFTVFKIIVDMDAAEEILDLLTDRYLKEEGTKALILSVNALLPQDRTEQEEEEAGRGGRRVTLKRSRHNQYELLEEIESEMRFSLPFLLLVGLSAIVASFGLYADNVAVIIGAMVIAPLAGPNVGLGLAATLAHKQLALRAGMLNTVAVGGAIAIAILLGWILDVDPTNAELVRRTTVTDVELALAMAAGAAGVVGITTGAHTALIGVMVAVALVPAMAATGLLIGAGHFAEAAGAAKLLAVNLIGINVAAVAMLYIQGVRPHHWWEDKRAKKATVLALAIWLTLLAALGLIVLYT